MENKESIKNKYYFEFLVNFINKNSNVLGEDDLRSFKMEDLIKIAGTYTDDVEHKWILSDENFQYLSELAKNDNLTKKEDTRCEHDIVCKDKEAIKNKYYTKFLINFIKKHQRYTSDAVYIFTIEELTVLAMSYVKDSNDLSYKWVLSDEYSEYLNEISKDDKTLPMNRIITPWDKRFHNDSFITKPTEEPKVMEDVPELNKEEIMKKISGLSSYSTKELFDELIKRGGVEAHWLNPESSYSLDIKLPNSCHDSVRFDGRGPVWIIFNYD